jgi:hypothetical protein
MVYIAEFFSLETLPPLIPALIWTRKDIREFKDGIRKTPENVLRVSSLSTATVRVGCFFRAKLST